jgi:DNA polymerase-3 subunit gamma/tau
LDELTEALMSYKVLARKWRPQSFNELVGQEHVLRALVNALDNDRLHQAYLFTGTRGVGKTTIARIFAKSLNCETGVSSTPCNQCATCLQIIEGRFVDLIEVDAASRTKVEDTRELIENVQYVPTQGRYKVYLIDEVHMLSMHSFNALLKTLEEPPPHVKFLLATTDPQRLPITILSRCLQFNLKRLPTKAIHEHLKTILKEEHIPFDEGGQMLIAKSADGSMRDALSLLDQAISYGNGELKKSEVAAMLGSIDQTHIFDILDALNKGDAEALHKRIEQLAEQSPDFSSVLAELTSTLHQIALAQATPKAISDSYENRETVLNLAQQMSAENVQLYYQISLIGRRDLPLAPDPHSGFEMVILRMLAFRPSDIHLNTADSDDHQNLKKHQQSGANNQQPEKKPQKAKVDNSLTTATDQGKSADVNTVYQSESDWESVVAKLSLTGLAQQLALNCAMAVNNEEKIELNLSIGNKHLLNDQRANTVQTAVQQFLGNKISLAIKLENEVMDTPANHIKQRQLAKQQGAEREIEDDTTVKNFIDTFDAQITPGSIRPIEEDG